MTVSDYRSPFWLPGRHLQTIYAYLFVRHAPPAQGGGTVALMDLAAVNDAGGSSKRGGSCGLLGI